MMYQSLPHRDDVGVCDWRILCIQKYRRTGGDGGVHRISQFISLSFLVMLSMVHLAPADSQNTLQLFDFFVAL